MNTNIQCLQRIFTDMRLVVVEFMVNAIIQRPQQIFFVFANKVACASKVICVFFAASDSYVLCWRRGEWTEWMKHRDLLLFINFILLNAFISLIIHAFIKYKMFASLSVIFHFVAGAARKSTGQQLDIKEMNEIIGAWLKHATHRKGGQITENPQPSDPQLSGDDSV